MPRMTNSKCSKNNVVNCSYLQRTIIDVHDNVDKTDYAEKLIRTLMKPVLYV